MDVVNIACGSAAEAQYLVQVAHRLVILAASEHSALVERYDRLIAGLRALVHALDDQPRS